MGIKIKPTKKFTPTFDSGVEEKDPRKTMKKILKEHPYQPEVKRIPSRKERAFFKSAIKELKAMNEELERNMKKVTKEMKARKKKKRELNIKKLDEMGIGYLDGKKTYSLNKGGSVKGRSAKPSAENS